MKIIASFAVVLGGLAITTAAWAQEAGTTAPTSSTIAVQAAPADDPNEVVCHSAEPTVGSRIPGSRVCHTRKQWADMQRDSAQMLGQTQQQGFTFNPSSVNMKGSAPH